jgi:hypothetical protein
MLINWDGKPTRYEENLDKWIVLWKQATLAVRSGIKLLQTADLGYI